MAYSGFGQLFTALRYKCPCKLGFANTINILKGDSNFLFGPIMGLRKQNFMEGGSYGRITFTPLIEAGKKFKFIPWAGISFGAGFEYRLSNPFLKLPDCPYFQGSKI